MPTPMTFEGWIVPATRLGISSNGRISIHEYRWIKGGNIEDHGRGLYTFRVAATFTNDTRFKPLLFPDQLAQLRALYDARTVGSLVLPDIGRVLCRITEWDEDQDYANRNSAVANISFLEDEGNRFLPAAISAATKAGFYDACQKWIALVDAKRPANPEDLLRADIVEPEAKAFDLFNQISEAGNSILAIRDQANLLSELLASKVMTITGLFEDANRTRFFDNPMNFELLYALKELWAATIALAQLDPVEGGTLRKYRVTRVSTITQVAAAIYAGDTSKSRDLLGLNDFADAMAIPAGTEVTYLQAA